MIRQAPTQRCSGLTPAPSPSFVLDFVANPVIPPGWSFSRASAATYFDSTPLMRSATNDIPRFEHDPATGASRGLLLETARANTLPWSDQPEKWAPYGIQVSTDSTLAPDGVTLAREVTEDTSGGVHAVSEALSITTSNATYSLWVRVKAAERSIVQIMLTDSGSQDNCSANFNLSTCSTGATYKGSGAWSLNGTTCVPMANGWAECRITGFVTSATTIRANVYVMQADQVSHTFQGDGVSGLYLGGAQLEAGTSSTYIPTQGTSVTRAVDFLSTSNLPWLNPNEGTLVFDGAFDGVAGGGMFAFSLDDGTGNGIGIYKALGSGGINAYSSNTSGTPLRVTLTDGQRFRAAITWSNAGASASASINGGPAIPLSGANPVAPVELCIGSARTHQFSANLWARSLAYYTKRLADADLSALTALPAPAVS